MQKSKKFPCFLDVDKFYQTTETTNSWNKTIIFKLLQQDDSLFMHLFQNSLKEYLKTTICKDTIKPVTVLLTPTDNSVSVKGQWVSLTYICKSCYWSTSEIIKRKQKSPQNKKRTETKHLMKIPDVPCS